MNLVPFSLSLLKVHWKRIIGALLLTVIGVQTLRVAGLKSSLSAEKAGRLVDRETYKRAQMEATANAFAAKIKKEAEDAKKADAADSRADDLATRYRTLSLQYAAAQRQAGKPDLPGASKAPQGPDSASGAPIIPLGSILIPEADALICATNQGRLEAAHEWAISIDISPSINR